MKKVYLNPTCMIVELGTCRMMAESAPVGEEPVDPGLFETKEHVTGDSKNIWDEEW